MCDGSRTTAEGTPSVTARTAIGKPATRCQTAHVRRIGLRRGSGCDRGRGRNAFVPSIATTPTRADPGCVQSPSTATPCRPGAHIRSSGWTSRRHTRVRNMLRRVVERALARLIWARDPFACAARPGRTICGRDRQSPSSKGEPRLSLPLGRASGRPRQPKPDARNGRNASVSPDAQWSARIRSRSSSRHFRGQAACRSLTGWIPSWLVMPTSPPGSQRTVGTSTRTSA